MRISAALAEAAAKTTGSAVGPFVRWTSIVSIKSGRQTQRVTRWRTTFVAGRGTTVVPRGRRPWVTRPEIPSLAEDATWGRKRRATIITLDTEHAPGARIGVEPKH